MNPLKLFLGSVVVLTAAMSPWLIDYVQLSLNNTLYSHVLLIPLVSLYLGWQKKDGLATSSSPRRWLALVPAGAAGAVLVWRFSEFPLSAQDAVAPIVLAYVFLIWACALVFLGWITVRQLLFPLGFLLAMVPFTTAVENGIESLLQHGSAECAYWMFRASGLTLYRLDLLFHLPGITLEVAPECSGIRSSLVLFIVSLVGGYLFLQSPWRRTFLVFFVIPLALIRNGFRVFVIGQLCVQIGPHMIDSFVHRHGGPFFFALSLIPFFIVVWLLMRGERRASLKAAPPVSDKPAATPLSVKSP